ncbi:FecR family protein [Flavobacteriaceae bacterium F08102]|nr:FecR family protein [Flavobacteriaceae bacterium F08102]
MQKEILIQKWLDGELNAEEMEAFKALPEYASYAKLSEKALYFKDESYDVDLEFNKLNDIISRKRQQKTETSTKKPVQWLNPLMRVAAILVVGMLVYFAPIYGDTTTIKTLASNKTAIELPDNSHVNLNAASSIQFKKGNWEEKRQVNLVGEAFFNVAEGSQFDVVTWLGKVSVLGTQFNVKQRVNYFEVSCYEGVVSVTYKDRVIKLPAGKTFKLIDGEIIEGETNEKSPSWSSKNISSFKSVPYSQVIHEFERQYDVKIETQNVDTTQLFTGSFTQKNKELALKAITLPLQLKYKQNTNKITLTKE